MPECENKEYEKDIRVRARARNPHGLALAKARAIYRRYADRRTLEEHEVARQWTRDTDCDGDCVKGGTSVISSHHIYREWESPSGKRATVRGIMRIRATVDCHDPVYASQLEEGSEEIEVAVLEEGECEQAKI